MTEPNTQPDKSTDARRMVSGVEVRKQNKLSFGRCLDLVLNGIRFRLFRALITVGIIALAMAFLTTMLTEALIGRQVGNILHARTAPRRAYVFWVRHMTSPMSEDRLITTSTTTTPGSPQWQELAAWGGLDAAGIERIAACLKNAAVYRTFLEGIPEGRRRPLVGATKGLGVFDVLSSDVELDRFRDGLVTLGLRFPTPFDAFRDFIASWHDTAEMRQHIIAGHRDSVARVAKLRKGRTSTQWLADLDDAVLQQLAAAGFVLTPEAAATVREEAAQALDAERLREQLAVPLVRQRLANRLDISDVSSVVPNDLFSVAATAGGAAWFVALPTESGAPFPLDAARVQAVAHYQLGRGRLQAVETAVRATVTNGGFLGFSPRVLCLVAVSLLVCTVGIANAMLMSVMERFREIATMKCLGATDRFLMSNFILESCCQGIVGGIVGAMLGLVLGALKAATVYGIIVFSGIPYAELLIWASASVGLGMMLSSLAAVYPAAVAARLAPMEAMRVE